MEHLTIQRWVPSGQAGAVVTHSPSAQLQPPTYEDPALRLRSGETWRDVASLGSGAFGSVMLQEFLEPGTGAARPLRAVKKIVEPRCCPHSVCLHRYSVKNEIRANSIFPKERPSMFVQCFGWYERQAAVYLCLEYMPLGNLCRCIDRVIPEADVLGIAQQILNGIRYLHEKGCCHRDIRPPVSLNKLVQTPVPVGSCRVAHSLKVLKNILVASRPPGPEGWRVKIADFGICAFAGEDGYIPWKDVQQGYAIVLDLILFRAALPIRPPPGMATGVVGGEGDRSLLETGLSQLCLGFMDWCDARRNGRLTAAGVLRHPWMQLRNWGGSHRLTPVARSTVSPDGSSDMTTDSGSRYAFVNADSGAWRVGVGSGNDKFRWASLTESQAASSAGDSVVAGAPEIWEGDAPHQFRPALFLTVGGIRGEERDDNTSRRIRQSTHPTKPVAVFSADWHLIEYGSSAARPVNHLDLPSRILSIGHSPDGARLLIALSEDLGIHPCDGTTGLCSVAKGRIMQVAYPRSATEVTAVAISSRREVVAVGTERGQVWLGRPMGGSWERGQWAMIHDVSMEFPGPYLSMEFSAKGDKIVAVSGANCAVVSVSSAGSLPMGRVSREVPGALAAVLSPENSQVFVAGWDPEAGEAWTGQFAVACLAGGCGECTETRPLNEFW